MSDARDVAATSAADITVAEGPVSGTGSAEKRTQNPPTPAGAVKPQVKPKKTTSKQRRTARRLQERAQKVADENHAKSTTTFAGQVNIKLTKQQKKAGVTVEQLKGKLIGPAPRVHIDPKDMVKEVPIRKDGKVVGHKLQPLRRTGKTSPPRAKQVKKPQAQAGTKPVKPAQQCGYCGKTGCRSRPVKCPECGLRAVVVTDPAERRDGTLACYRKGCDYGMEAGRVYVWHKKLGATVPPLPKTPPPIVRDAGMPSFAEVLNSPNPSLGWEQLPQRERVRGKRSTGVERPPPPLEPVVVVLEGGRDVAGEEGPSTPLEAPTSVPASTDVDSIGTAADLLSLKSRASARTLRRRAQRRRAKQTRGRSGEERSVSSTSSVSMGTQTEGDLGEIGTQYEDEASLAEAIENGQARVVTVTAFRAPGFLKRREQRRQVEEIDDELLAHLQSYAAFKPRTGQMQATLSTRARDWVTKTYPGISEREKCDKVVKAVRAAMVPTAVEEETRQFLSSKSNLKQTIKASKAARGHLGKRGFFRKMVGLEDVDKSSH